MQRKLTRRIRWTGLALALTATLVPPTAAGMILGDGGGGSSGVADLRSPDARDSVPSAQGKILADLRSPDARDSVPPAQGTVLADLRSPDARDTVPTAKPEVIADLRSPDARDVQPAPTQVVASRRSPHSGDALRAPTQIVADRRAPDSRDIADGYVFANAPSVEVVRLAEPAGFSWDDAGIGAVTTFGLIALALGASIALRHARRSQLTGA